MKTTARLTALMAIVLLVSGCSTGLRHKDRAMREPVQLPSAPSLGGPSSAPLAAPNMSDSMPSPLSGTAPSRPAGGR